MTPSSDGKGLARVEERGDQENKKFVVVLSADEDGREKDLRSFGVEGGGRYDPVKQKAERFAERVNTAHQVALTAERKRVLEMAEKDIELARHSVLNPGYVYVQKKREDDISMGKIAGFAEASRIVSSLLSRLEGEGKP